MKKFSMLIVCLLLASFVFAGLPAISRLAEPQIVEAQEESDRLVQLLTIVAKKVDEIPAIDGAFSDPAWAEAKPTSIGATTWKAVYTDDEVAMYIRWMANNASLNTDGTWNWDSKTQSWWQTEGFKAEWFNIAFDISTSEISSAPMTEKGCGAFCHEYPPGSGIFHHQTAELGAHVDSWMILAKHGFGVTGLEDLGWFQGVTSTSQEGELIFNPSDSVDTHRLINGKITFVGYAEDKVMSSPDDPIFAARDTPADRYCQKCHVELGVPGDPLKVDYTFGDPGEILYSENWNEIHSAPLYIELAPENWVDAMVLTQAEIDAGEAVLIADLSEAEITEYWDNYVALNGIVPHLILQEPSDSQADVRVAATWDNGFWTVELKRNLVTDCDYDVQFDDLSRDYPFAVTLGTRSHGQFVNAVGGTGNVGWTLRFE